MGKWENPNEKETGNRKKFLGRGFQMAETPRKAVSAVLDIQEIRQTTVIRVVHAWNRERRKLNLER